MIIFDLDGTLLNVWKRYFIVFNSWWKINNLDLDSYINLKRELRSDFFIIKEFYDDVTEKEYNFYKKYKKENIEKPEFLRLDNDIVNWDNLKSLDYIILTIRNDEHALYNDLKQRGLSYILDKLIILKPIGDNLIKYYWVEKHLKFKNNIYVVGDSETDLLIGKLQRVNITLVDTGLRNPKILIKEYANEIANKVETVNSVNEFLNFFN